MFHKHKLRYNLKHETHGVHDFPLHAAIRRTSDVIIHVTPSTGSTLQMVNQEDQDRNTALHLAAERGYEQWVEYLLSNKADKDVINRYGMSPLMLAVRHQHPRVVLQLLSHGANVHLTNSIGQTAIHYVCCTGCETSLNYLLQKKAKINVQDNEGVTPLTMACKMGQPKILKQLLDFKTVAKANPNLKDKFCRSPLHWAAERGEAECARALIAAKADLNAEDGDHETPFVRAIKQNRLDVLDVLIEAGCDRTDIDGLNGTAMTMACMLGRNQVIQRLLAAGEDINEYGHIGVTPLTAAVFECQVNTVQMLLDNGADPDKPTRKGATPLVKASCYLRESDIPKRHEVTKMLLRANADPNIRVTMAGVFTELTKGRNCPLSFAISAGCISLAMMQLIGGSRITAYEVMEWANRSRDNFNGDNIDEDMLPLYNWAVEVRPLKFLCRKLIRDLLGPMVQKKIHKLPLPPPVIWYMDLGELDLVNETMIESPEFSALRTEGFCKVNRPCGLRTLQGTLVYESLSA